MTAKSSPSSFGWKLRGNLRWLRARTPDHSRNENVIQDSSQDSGSPDARAPERSSDSCLIDRVDLLSGSRSSCRRPNHHEKHACRKAFRKELRRAKRCPNNDRLLCREFVRVTYNRLCQLPLPDRYSRVAWECRSVMRFVQVG